MKQAFLMKSRAMAVVALLAMLATVSIFAQGRKKDLADAGSTQGLLSQPGPTFVVSTSAIPKRWTMIAYGDTRFTDPANTKATNPKVRRWLVAKIASEHPDALLITGDLPYNGSVANDYAVFHDETTAWREEKLRVYPALGNHELHGGGKNGLANWWAAFPELKNRRWYSVEFGNAYLIALDTDLALTPGSMQQVWLIDQLDHLPGKTQFVILFLHHPPVADIQPGWSHNPRPNEIALAKLLEAKAAGSRAKYVVIAGHIHNYERFDQNGIVYLVSGGGGAKPAPIERKTPDLYLDPVFPNYHYIKFTMERDGLHGTMVRAVDLDTDTPEWQAKDRFVVRPKRK